MEENFDSEQFRRKTTDLKDEFVGISEDRMRHIISVARKAYKLAKENGCSENFARKMFVLGFIHDIGYEFTQKDSHNDHVKIGSDLMYLLFGQTVAEIEEHGNPSTKNWAELYFLNQADMTVGHNGVPCSVEERMEKAKERYGEQSMAYKKTVRLAKALHLF